MNKNNNNNNTNTIVWPTAAGRSNQVSVPSPSGRSCKKCKYISHIHCASSYMCLYRLPARHLPSVTVSKRTPRPRRAMPPPSSHRVRFLHWLTSKYSSFGQPSTTDSTPAPVTRTQPRTDSSRRSRRCSAIDPSDESETALPQNAMFKCVRFGQPRARTSVAVSDRAQQNDCNGVNKSDGHTSWVCLPDQAHVTALRHSSGRRSHYLSGRCSLPGRVS